jgi:hypothetical protein
MTECDRPELTFSCDLCSWFRGGYPASLDSTLIINELFHGDTRLWSFGSEV